MKKLILYVGVFSLISCATISVSVTKAEKEADRNERLLARARELKEEIKKLEAQHDSYFYHQYHKTISLFSFNVDIDTLNFQSYTTILTCIVCAYLSRMARQHRTIWRAVDVEMGDKLLFAHQLEVTEVPPLIFPATSYIFESLAYATGAWAAYDVVQELILNARRAIDIGPLIEQENIAKNALQAQKETAPPDTLVDNSDAGTDIESQRTSNICQLEVPLVCINTSKPPITPLEIPLPIGRDGILREPLIKPVREPALTMQKTHKNQTSFINRPILSPSYTLIPNLIPQQQIKNPPQPSTALVLVRTHDSSLLNEPKAHPFLKSVEPLLNDKDSQLHMLCQVLPKSEITRKGTVTPVLQNTPALSNTSTALVLYEEKSGNQLPSCIIIEHDYSQAHNKTILPERSFTLRILKHVKTAETVSKYEERVPTLLLEAGTKTENASLSSDVALIFNNRIFIEHVSDQPSETCQNTLDAPTKVEPVARAPLIPYKTLSLPEIPEELTALIALIDADPLSADNKTSPKEGLTKSKKNPVLKKIPQDEKPLTESKDTEKIPSTNNTSQTSEHKSAPQQGFGGVFLPPKMQAPAQNATGSSGGGVSGMVPQHQVFFPSVGQPFIQQVTVPQSQNQAPSFDAKPIISNTEYFPPSMNTFSTPKEENVKVSFLPQITLPEQKKVAKKDPAPEPQKTTPIISAPKREERKRYEKEVLTPKKRHVKKDRSGPIPVTGRKRRIVVFLAAGCFAAFFSRKLWSMMNKKTSRSG